MAARELMLPANRAFNGNGVPVAGAKAYLYLSGGTTPANFYSDSTLITSLGSVITANAIGRFPLCYQDSGTAFRLIIKNAAGTQLDDIDPFYFGQSVIDFSSLYPAAVGLFTGMSALTIPTGIDIISTTGYATLDKGGALYIYDATVDSTYVAANPRSSFLEAGGRGFRLSEEQAITPQMFGAVADNVTDDYAAIQAAIDYLATLKMTTQYGYGFGSPKLFQPASKTAYYCSQKLIVSHTVVWEFENGEGAAGGGAVLRFPSGQGGILLKYDVTTGGAAGAVLIRPFLEGGFAGTEGEHHGIEFQTHCKLVGPNVYNFEGDGIFTDTDVVGNVNGTIIENPLVQGNRNGLYIAGANSNALTILNPEPLRNRRYGHWQSLTLGSAILSGNSTDNGQTATGGGIPFTMCSNGTNRYFVLPNQDAAASTTAPPAGATNNAVWAYFGPGGAYLEGPLWVSGTQTFRAGGAARFEGQFEQNVFVSYYFEPDQAPIVCDPLSQGIFLSAISGRPRNFDGTPYGGAMFGSGSGLSITGSLNVGDTANGVLPGGAILNVGGDAYLTRGNAVSWDPTLHINTTNAYATVQFEYQMGLEAQFQYYHGGGFYSILSNSAHLHHFDVGGTEIATIGTSGLVVEHGSMGYGTGAGAAVTQLTNKSTATPAINKACGQITMNNAALAGGAKISFVVTNSTVAATDTIIVSIASGGTANAYRAAVTAISAGVSFTVTVENITGGSLSEAPVINFAVIKAVAA